MMFWLAYCGYCCAIASAPSNDFVSSALDAVGDVLPGSGDRRRGRGGVARRQQRAEDRLHDRAAEVALEVRCARRHPDALTGTEPVSECDAGVPAKPTPMPTNAYPSATRQ